MDLARHGNLIEAGVWFLLAIILFVHALRSDRSRRPILFVLVISLALFGGSDLVESRTGAWWTPWWLFAWKALCVATLFFGFLRYYALTRKKAVDAAEKITSTSSNP